MGVVVRFLGVMVVVVLGFFAYQTHTEPQVRHNSLAHRFMYPTDVRVRYRIGEVDARFGLSRDEVKRLAHEAVMIWHEGTGGEWFVYDERAKLAINLIYDERQMETEARQAIKQNLDNLHARHQEDSEALEARRQRLQSQFRALEREWQAWEADYHKVKQALAHTHHPEARSVLIGRLHALLQTQDALNAKGQAYDALQKSFNQSVNELNHQATTINQVALEAQARLTPREFHKGTFHHGSDTVINIYEFANIHELRLVLAHELGHALYLDHNDDPTALMYPYAQSQDLENFTLKQADIELLENRQFYK